MNKIDFNLINEEILECVKNVHIEYDTLHHIERISEPDSEGCYNVRDLEKWTPEKSLSGRLRYMVSNVISGAISQLGYDKDSFEVVVSKFHVKDDFTTVVEYTFKDYNLINPFYRGRIPLDLKKIHKIRDLEWRKVKERTIDPSTFNLRNDVMPHINKKAYLSKFFGSLPIDPV
jgi:hypothetical protein